MTRHREQLAALDVMTSQLTAGVHALDRQLRQFEAFAFNRTGPKAARTTDARPVAAVSAWRGAANTRPAEVDATAVRERPAGSTQRLRDTAGTVAPPRGRPLPGRAGRSTDPRPARAPHIRPTSPATAVGA